MMTTWIRVWPAEPTEPSEPSRDAPLAWVHPVLKRERSHVRQILRRVAARCRHCRCRVFRLLSTDSHVSARPLHTLGCLACGTPVPGLPREHFTFVPQEIEAFLRLGGYVGPGVFR